VSAPTSLDGVAGCASGTDARIAADDDCLMPGLLSMQTAGP
jgi:hypothetical protein